MTTNKTITFSEFRRFLARFGYVEKRFDTPKLKASVFHHDGKHRLFYQLYQEDEALSERDLWMTRLFLDSWGYLEKEDFDAFFRQATTPA